MRRFIIFLCLSMMLFSINVKAEAVVDITGLSIEKLHELVDEGLLTYEAITKIYLDRIDAFAEEYGVVISVNDDALNQARQLDEEYRKSGRRSKVFGIPLIVKDNIDVFGMPTTAGAKGLLENYPKQDAEVIKALRDGGAIFIAKANMDEFSFHANFSKSSFGTVLNAYNKKYSSYGSSGGTAVGVALDLAVAGLGTDTGTSVRVPASANHVIGHRPSKDEIPMEGVISFESYRDVVGPIAKNSEDAKIIYEAITNTEKEVIDITSLTIGVYMPEMRAAPNYVTDLINKKIFWLKENGIEVKEVNDVPLYYDFDATNLCYEFNQYIKNTEGPIRSLTDLIETGEYTQYIERYVGAECEYDYTKTQEYAAYRKNFEAYERRMNSAFENLGIDVLIYPTMSTPMYTLEESSTSKLVAFGSEIPPQSGFPAMNIPVGFYDGLPYGLEAVARKGNDHYLYALAKEIEEGYKLPEGLEALYEVHPQVKDILDILELDHDSHYDSVLNSMRDFILNYYRVEDKQAKIDELLEMYEEVGKREVIKKYVFIGGSVFVFGSIIWVFVRRKRR